jgi:hypothetical protein
MFDALAAEMEAIEMDLQVEFVFESLVDRFLSEQIASVTANIGFSDIAYQVLLADAAAGTISPTFVRQLVRVALPAVAFPLLSNEERLAFSDDDVQSFGETCACCFGVYDCLRGGAAATTCCDSSPVYCADCLPGVVRKHRDEKPHAKDREDGGLTLCYELPSSRNLRRMREGFQG